MVDVFSLSKVNDAVVGKEKRHEQGFLNVSIATERLLEFNPTKYSNYKVMTV